MFKNRSKAQGMIEFGLLLVLVAVVVVFVLARFGPAIGNIFSTANKGIASLSATAIPTIPPDIPAGANNADCRIAGVDGKSWAGDCYTIAFNPASISPWDAAPYLLSWRATEGDYYGFKWSGFTTTTCPAPSCSRSAFIFSNTVCTCDPCPSGWTFSGGSTPQCRPGP